MPRLGRIFQSPRLERSALPTVVLHPGIRTLLSAISHTRQLVQQSNINVTHYGSIEVSSTHVCDGNQERVENSKNVFLTRNTKQDSQSFQRRCRREDRFDPFVAHFRTHQTRAVTCGFGAAFVGINPLEVNWAASSSRPCLCFVEYSYTSMSHKCCMFF